MEDGDRGTGYCLLIRLTLTELLSTTMEAVDFCSQGVLPRDCNGLGVSLIILLSGM